MRSRRIRMPPCPFPPAPAPVPATFADKYAGAVVTRDRTGDERSRGVGTFPEQVHRTPRIECLALEIAATGFSDVPHFKSCITVFFDNLSGAIL